MNLSERAEKYASEIIADAGIDHHTNTFHIIRRALIEQDKITRHAAAEAIVDMPQWEVNGYDILFSAHSAVITCTGGVK